MTLARRAVLASPILPAAPAMAQPARDILSTLCRDAVPTICCFQSSRK